MSIVSAQSPQTVTSGDEDFRLSVWRAHGATAQQAAELRAYAASPLQEAPPQAQHYPLPDAACVADWSRYEAEASEAGVLAVLRRVLVQLRFPIAKGMSKHRGYLAATRRGVLPPEDADADNRSVSFVQPDGLRIFLVATAAGRVPIIQATAREDFDSLVRAVMEKNEPVPIPASMGACLVAGYNNWDRVASLRRAFEAKHGPDPDGVGWNAAFQELIPQKDRYQDRFMLVSSGFYSSIAAHTLGLPDEEWRDASLRIRIAHECTHYVTRQAFGFMRKCLLDELVADYVGLVTAFGEFRADYFLRFMGLEHFPAYRYGGRLENYRGSPPLSAGAFAILPRVVVRAAHYLQHDDPSRRMREFGVTQQAQMIIAFMRVGLEGLACDDAGALLAKAIDEATNLT